MPSLPGRESLESWLSERGLPLDANQWGQLQGFLEEVSSQNEKVNITSDSGKALFLRHAADALAALPAMKRHLGSITAPSVLDLGAGAGFIGVTLKIAWPDMTMTLLESSQRKFRFLNWACSKLKTPGLHVILGRAPEALAGKTYDAVIIRAVASPDESARLGLSLARPAGGLCILYQTLPPASNDEKFLRSVQASGASILEVIAYNLPEEKSPRHLIFLKKGL